MRRPDRVATLFESFLELGPDSGGLLPHVQSPQIALLQGPGVAQLQEAIAVAVQQRADPSSLFLRAAVACTAQVCLLRLETPVAVKADCSWRFRQADGPIVQQQARPSCLLLGAAFTCAAQAECHLGAGPPVTINASSKLSRGS